MVHIGLSQTARMEQRLMQSPQMIQAMQILQLSALDLEERVEQELTENPFLEVVEKTATEEEAERARENDKDNGSLEGLIEDLERYQRDAPPRPRVSSDEADRKLEAMNNTPAQYHSLGDALLEQIALSDFDERKREIAEYLVYSLDPKGYLDEPLEDLVEACPVHPAATLEELQEVLRELRTATHPALGARDLQECLLLQLDPEDPENALMRTLIRDHLEDITTNRLPRVARTTGRTLEEIKQALDAIRALDPIPGREFGESPAETIHPDVVVAELDGEFEVRLTRQGVPELTVSPTYRELLRRAGNGEAVRKWIKQRLESARWFIEAVQQRQSTLLRIARVVFDHQRGFLERGVKGLAPLRMLEVAEATGVHISTVSRAVAGKYVQTPHGIHPLRFFFTGGTTKASGEMTSQASIKQRIKELIEKEDQSDPLSDDKLAELLKERDGISIARRTITKYRKALQIPSSNQRRVF